MHPRTLALAGLLLLVVPLVVGLLGLVWLPLGLFLLLVGGSLWVVKRYYVDPLSTHGRAQP